jgi:hydroxypyruvate reductase
VIARSLAELVFQRAIDACHPGRGVAAALARMGEELEKRTLYGLAVGKSAQAMARGIGPVARGLVVTVAIDGGDLPKGWRLMIAPHPVPDERSVEAARAALELVRATTRLDRLIVAISGGASALMELPRGTLAELVATTSAVMAAGCPIAELNVVRSALSAIKGGQLALSCPAPIITLAASDVIGDKLEVIGSGPTIGPWLEGMGRIVDFGAHAERRRRRAIAILEREGLAVPRVLDEVQPPHGVKREDRAVLVSALGEVARHARRELAAHGVPATALPDVMQGAIPELAVRLAKRALAKPPFVGYGEPTIRLPQDHGVGGRAQQLALELARHLRGTDRSALVAGTDGKDGPETRNRPSPAGAFVDGTTWDRILAMGIDPDVALARCDAGTALDAVDALFVTGPTGINHADLVIAG